MYREPNREGIEFPVGLPNEVVAGLVAQNAIKSVDPTSAGFDAHRYDLSRKIPDELQESVDKLMFNWLNDGLRAEELASRRLGENSAGERQDWLAKAGTLGRYNAYVYGNDYFGSDALDPNMMQALHPEDGNFPLVFEGIDEPEEGENQDDKSTLTVVKGPVYYGFEVDPDAYSLFGGGRRVKKIVPAFFSSSGFNHADIDADIPDSYSELSAGYSQSGSEPASSLSNKRVVENDGHYFNPRNLSQALTLALALPEGSRIRFDATRATTKTDALLQRATDLILKPIQPTTEGYGGSDVASSVVVLRAVHALFSKHNVTERRVVRTLVNFVASELVRSRHFPTGSRDKTRNFKEYAEIAVDLAQPLGMTEMQVLKAIHEAAPK